MTTATKWVLTRHSLDMLYQRVLRRRDPSLPLDRRDPSLPLDHPEDKNPIRERALEMLERAESGKEVYEELSPWLERCHRHSRDDRYIAKLDRQTRATFIIKRSKEGDIVLTALRAVCRTCDRPHCEHVQTARRRLRGRVPGFFMVEDE